MTKPRILELEDLGGSGDATVCHTDEVKGNICAGFVSARRAAKTGSAHCTKLAVEDGFCEIHASAGRKLVTRGNPERVLKKYEKLGQSLKVSPINALLSLIYECAGNVQYYRNKVSDLERLVLAGKKEREEVSKIIVLYNEERDRLQKYTSDALRIGIETKQTRLYELQAQAYVQMTKAMIEELGLKSEQRERALKIAAEQLRSFSAQSHGDADHTWKGPFLSATQIGALA